MEIIYKKTSELIPYVNNSRTHSEEQIKQICSSINEFGFTNPVLIDEKGMIIAGHGRVLASERLKLDEVPCIVLEGLTEAQKKAYVIADNKMALNAGWDEELLKLELQNLKELDFNMDLTGFNIDELDNILGEIEQEKEVHDDDFDVDDAIPEEPIAKAGDIYQLGNHRLMCGDSTSEEDVAKLMGESKADVSVNIYAFKKAQETGKVVELCCAIGDEEIDGKPYIEIVEEARQYINEIGGFEKFAEWGLY